jgi:co-chaperonin GroES (HSP10)
MKPVTPGHRVLVKPDSLGEIDPVFASAQKAGLKLLERTERQEATIIDTGIVVQLGPTAYKDFGGADNWCKVGDKVSYTRHGGKFISDPENDENKWLVLNDEDIIMVWETNNE